MNNLGTDYLKDIVALHIAEVPHPDLDPHGPAVKRTSWEFQPSDIKEHVRDGRKCVPLYVRFLKPFIAVKKRKRNQTAFS